MNHTRPPGTIAYEPDADAAARLVQNRADYSPLKLEEGGPPVAALLIHQSWFSLCTAIGNMSPGAVVFSHRRTSPAGHVRLVVTSFWSNFDDVQRGILYPAVMLPGSKLGPLPKQLSSSTRLAIPLTITCALDDKLRLYAGQPDPSDPSHFTIDFDFNGRRGVIDGWLRNDELVTLWPRSGRIDWELNNTLWFAKWCPE